MRGAWAGVCLLSVLAVAGCGRDAGAIRARADRMYETGNYVDAELQYRKLVATGKADGDTYYRLGRTYVKTGKLDQAYAAFKTAAATAESREDASAGVAELLLASFWHDPRKPRPVYDELVEVANRILAKNPNSYAGHRVLGYIALFDGRTEAARESFTKALALRPSDADTTAMLMQVLERSGDTKAAEQLGRSYIGKHSSESLVYEILARLYTDGGRGVDAEKVLEEQVAANPNSVNAIVRLAAYYHGRKEVDKAAQTLGSLNDSKRFPEGKFAIADFYERAGQLEEAFAKFAACPGSAACGKRQIGIRLVQGRFAEALPLVEAALGKDPNDAELLRSKALILAEGNQRIDDAVEQFRRAVKADPQQYQTRFHLGRLLVRKGDVAGGEAELKEALRLAPGAIEVSLGLASASLLRLDYAGALRYSERVLDNDARNEAALLTRMAALRGLGRFAEARAILRGLAPRPGMSSTIDLESAYLLVAEGKASAAETIFRRLYEPGVDNVRILAGLAEALTAQAKHDEAAKLLLADLTRRPGRPIVMYALAETLARKGDITGAVAAYQSLVAAHPDIPAAYQRLAALHVSSGKIEDAVGVLRRAKGRFEGDRRMVAALAQVLELAGKPEEAEQSYREWLRAEPANATASNNLAYLLADRGRDLNEALTLASAAVRTAPGEASFKDTLGYVYLKKGEKAEALRLFRGLVAQYPEDVMIRYHYALALETNGDRTKSRAEMERVLRANPPESVKSQVMEALRQG